MYRVVAVVPPVLLGAEVAEPVPADGTVAVVSADVGPAAAAVELEVVPAGATFGELAC